VDGETPVQIPPDEHVQAGAGASSGLRGDLQDLAAEGDRIVRRDDAFLLVTEDLVKLGRRERHKGRRALAGRTRERGVVLRHEPLDQILIGGGDGGDARDTQFVDQPILKRSVEPLAAAARLWGVRRNVLDASRREGAADLRQPSFVDRAFRTRRIEGPARPIGIDRHG
jgi:hypothetical protein